MTTPSPVALPGARDEIFRNTPLIEIHFKLAADPNRQERRGTHTAAGDRNGQQSAGGESSATIREARASIQACIPVWNLPSSAAMCTLAPLLEGEGLSQTS